jgi:hypothetical protein
MGSYLYCVLRIAIQGMQMAVITVRVPRELKEAMDKLDVNWSEEIRRFIARRVDEELRRRRLEEAIVILRGTGSVERGFAEKAVREDRDSR